MSLFISGGAGFIGANFIMSWLDENNERIVNFDKLTYAGNMESLNFLKNDRRHHFIQGDIADEALLARVFQEHKPRAIINFAAESHVDRSIHGPDDFIQTNIVGTFRLLEAARHYWMQLDNEAKASFRFLHVSTDEVYGSLTPEAPAFTETNRFQPTSPYSASKAASDHLVNAYYHTYGLPVLITNCSNNYGPYQFPEKLIPLMIHNALKGLPLPVYGDGMNIRDWLYVMDHCSAIRSVLQNGKAGETYNIGGNSEITNLDVVQSLCDILDEKKPKADGTSYRAQITFVADRPGHDRRYAVDAAKIRRDLGWVPAESFTTGLRKTVQWYLDNAAWVANVTSGSYREWLLQHYGEKAA